MKDLYTVIIEDGYDDTTVGESIIETFCNGNFTDGCEQLLKNDISIRDFYYYIKEYSDCEENDSISEFRNGYFDGIFWIKISEFYNGMNNNIL